MKKNSIKCLLLSNCAFFFLLAANPAFAERQTIVSGSLSVRESYDSNIDRTTNNEVEEWNTILFPTLNITSTGSQDTINCSYSPNYVYNHRTNNNRFDHALSLAANRMTTRMVETKRRIPPIGSISLKICGVFHIGQTISTSKANGIMPKTAL